MAPMCNCTTDALRYARNVGAPLARRDRHWASPIVRVLTIVVVAAAAIVVTMQAISISRPTRGGAVVRVVSTVGAATSPVYGPMRGGTRVTITGAGLTGVTSVH